ncbi:ABC transporter permease [Candidatus Bathyarchaeota archaeon]|nr:ABC transporter permease [Candidatus Bathyarchaeota archaeon]
MGSFSSLVSKEIKELIRDPKILFGVVLLPLLLYPLMGQGIQISQESVQQAIQGASFSLYTDDHEEIAAILIQYLLENHDVVNIQASNLESALKKFQESNSIALVYVPNGYSQNITYGLKGSVKIYGNLKNFNLAEAQSSQIAGSVVANFGYYYSLTIIQHLLQVAEADYNPSFIKEPLKISFASVIKGNVIEISPSQITNVIMNQSIMLPMMIMMMVIFAIQMASTSIALEKEQKTLETLMTLPVSRLTILGGKLAGSIVIAIAGSISYMIGFSYYTSSALSFAGETTSVVLTGTGIGIQPIGYLFLGIVMFITLVSALALAISLAVFTDNVRSAQSLTGILVVPLIVPALILMFADIEMLPTTVQWILLVIPYTHSMLATKAAFLGNYWIILRSIAYISVFTFVVLWIAARIFSTERIITSRFTNFSFRKKPKENNY